MGDGKMKKRESVDVSVGDSTIRWVEALHQAGATRVVDGKPEIHPELRPLVSKMHVILAGDTQSELYQELENMFESAVSEASQVSSARAEDPDGATPVPLFP
jgi:hypothetical protein